VSASWSGEFVPVAERYPLEDIRVLDLTQYVAGPYCTQVLADLGATVLKVERPPSGDVYRAQGPVFIGGESVSFLAMNRGKGSVALDLRDSDDRATLRHLVGEADVLVENFKPGTLERFGLDFTSLEPDHPRLIYCSISGFGQRGPLAGEAAYDLSMQALSGIMSLTGHPGQPPAKVPIAALDFGAALYATVGILAALHQRQASGRGQWVQTSLLETGLAWLSMHITSYLGGGEEPRRLGSRSPFFAPYEAYATADGHLSVVGTGGNNGWEAFCRALGVEGLREDPRFATNSDRVTNAEALREEVEKVMRRLPTAHWEQRMREEGVPNAPVQTLPDVLASEQVAELGALAELSHPTAGEVPIVRLPLSFSRAAATTTMPPPALDSHAGRGFATELETDRAGAARESAHPPVSPHAQRYEHGQQRQDPGRRSS
jgi:crotonobetainyl-CoA:carnitine CoA-transferase CaiB-like acyl-CoA transferase